MSVSSARPAARILIIEDEKGLVEVLRYNLQREGYEVDSAYDGLTGLTKAAASVPDLVILDVMLPGLDGQEICRQLRQRRETASVAILMLTARAEESDQLVGFACGADDYVTKPFSVKVLLQRVKALLRRPRVQGDEILEAGDLRLDRRSRRVTLRDSVLALTPSEFRLLETLLRQKGRAFTRQELIAAALGDVIVLERTIDVHIKSLRKKLGTYGEYIETVRGVGYRFRET
ncbi:MAG: DNA-binding response regulator [Gemmataceae bacterium]